VLVHNCGLRTKDSNFGPKVEGPETEVKNAVNEAKVERAFGDSSKAECAKCKLTESVKSRRAEQNSFLEKGQSKSSDEFKRHEKRIEFEEKQLNELE